MGKSSDYQLIVTIVDKEKTDKILDALEQEGITKSTIILSRGVSENNPTLFWGVKIEPQRDVIYTLVPKQKVDNTFDIIMDIGELDKPLHGIVFVLDVAKVGGMSFEG